MRKKNRMLLMQKAPELVSQEEYFIQNGYEKSEVIPSKSGQPTLKYHTEEGEVFVHSAYDPEREAAMIAEKFNEAGAQDVFLFVGVGLGYALRAISKCYPANDLLLWEPEPEFLYRWWDTLDVDPKLWEHFLGLSTEPDTVLERMTKPEMMHRKIHFVFSSFHESAFRKQIRYFMSRYQALMLEKRENFLAGLSFYDRQLLSNMKNMGRILSSPSLAKDTRKPYRGKPAVLVSAGPSLNEELENLKKIYEEGTAVIFACGSSVHTMLKNGIVPHAMAAIDSGLPMQELMQPIKEGDYKSITLFFGDCAGFEALEDYPGQLVWLNSEYEAITSKFVGNSDSSFKFGAYSTVANTALEIAFHLGFSDIVLVGQNFAFRGKERYAKDMSFSTDIQFFDAEENKGILVECLSVEGKVLQTLYGYEMMRSEMEDLISKHSEEAKIYNTTRGGAAIQGTEYVELSALMETLFTKKVAEREIRFDILDKSVIDCDAMRKSLIKYDQAFNEVLDLLKRYQRDIEKIEDILDSDELNQQLYRLNDRVSDLQTNPYAEDFLLYATRTHIELLSAYVPTMIACTSVPEKRQMMKERYGYFYHLLFATYVEFSPHYEEFRKVLLHYMETGGKKNV